MRDGGPSSRTVLAAAVLALLALGAGGVGAARALSRRRPENPSTPATGDGEELAGLSEADILLQGVDVDAELQRLLAHGDPERAAVPAEPDHPR